MKQTIIPAKPQPVGLDIARSVIIVVDMQNDFVSRGGMFDRAGIDISPVQKVINPIKLVIETGRKAGLPVIYLKMGFLSDLSDMGDSDAPNKSRHLLIGVGKTITAPDGSKSRILIRDMWGTDIVNELKPQEGENIIYKHRFSGFFQTNLDSLLKIMNIKTLIFTGCTTSVCVESTVRDAMFRDYKCIILEDCMAEPIGSNFSRTNHDASILLMQTLFGWVTQSKEFIGSLKRDQIAVY
jgi:ureidoacrylate peracid hydrolase